MGQHVMSDLLQALAFGMTGGTARVLPMLLAILSGLLTLELVLTGAWWLYNRDLHAGAVMQKIFIGLGLVVVMRQWPMFTNATRDTMIQLGVVVGGSNLTVGDVLNPELILQWGFSVIAVVVTPKTGVFAMLTSPVETLIVGLSCLLIMLATIAMAAFVTKALFAFTLASAFCVVLVPFGMWQKTAFLAERGFALICSHAIKLGMLALVLSSLLPFMVRFQLQTNPDYKHLFQLLAAAITMLGIMLSADKMAHTLCSGSPSIHSAITDMGRSVITTVRAMRGR